MQEKFVERVWLKRYPEGVPAGSIRTNTAPLVEMFEESVTQFAGPARLRQHGADHTYRRLENSRYLCRLSAEQLKLGRATTGWR